MSLTAEQYNYRVFSLQSHELLDSYAGSPAPGDKAEDFPLLTLDGVETSLRTILGEHQLAVIEFGSIT